MICPKCGRDFSPKVCRIHREICSVVSVEKQEKQEKQELIKKARKVSKVAPSTLKRYSTERLEAIIKEGNNG